MLYSKSNYNTFKKLYQFIQKEKKLIFNLDNQFKEQLVNIIFTNLKKNENGETTYLNTRFSDLKNTIKGFFSIDNNTIIFSTDFLNTINEEEFINNCLEKKLDYIFLLEYFKQHKHCHINKLEKDFFDKFELKTKTPSLLQHFRFLLKNLKKYNKIFIIKNIIFSKIYEKNFGIFCENYALLDIYENQKFNEIYLKELKENKLLYINSSLADLCNQSTSYSKNFSYDVILKQKRQFFGVTIKSFSHIAHLNSNKEFLNNLVDFDTLSIEEKCYLTFNLNKSFKNFIAISNGKKHKLNGLQTYIHDNTQYIFFENLINLLLKLNQENKVKWTKEELTISGNNETMYEKIIFSEFHRGLKINIPLFLSFLKEYECVQSNQLSS